MKPHQIRALMDRTLDNGFTPSEVEAAETKLRSISSYDKAAAIAEPAETTSRPAPIQEDKWVRFNLDDSWSYIFLAILVNIGLALVCWIPEERKET